MWVKNTSLSQLWPCFIFILTLASAIPKETSVSSFCWYRSMPVCTFIHADTSWLRATKFGVMTHHRERNFSGSAIPPVGLMPRWNRRFPADCRLITELKASWMCVVEGEEPQLMFGSWHEVRQIGVRSGHYRSVVDGVHRATMLDFDYASNTVFYSERNLFSIHS